MTLIEAVAALLLILGSILVVWAVWLAEQSYQTPEAPVSARGSTKTADRQQDAGCERLAA